MQIIIDIAEEHYNDICNSQTASNYSVLEALDSIRNGTPAKEIYNKGFADGQKALSEHLKLCKEDKCWIPVSERLPEKDKYKDFYKCLIAVKYTSKHDICDTVTAYFDGKHFYSNRYDRCFIEGVKAWMPLPESYRAERNVNIEC